MEKDVKVPQIRFPEYTGQWKLYEMGELYTERNERGNDKLQILSVSIHSGVSDNELDEENLGKHVRRSEDKSKYKHVYAGDLVFNMMRAWQGAIGVAKNEGMISPAYISAVPNENIYPLFMDYALRREQTIEEINSLSYGVTDFRKRLYWNSFVQVKCYLPSVEEQRKIYEVIKTLDDLIKLQQQKCDMIRKYKKGCLQKMFPKEGANIPEIRFPGFTDTWEQQKLGELVTITTGKLDANAAKENGQYAFFTCGKEILKTDTFSFDGDAILISGNGDLGFTRKYSGKFNAYQRTYVLQEFRVDFEYIEQAIHRYLPDRILSESLGGAMPYIKLSTLSDLEILVPKQKEAQQVTTFLCDIDNLITLQQREGEMYKDLKKGLLQKMFV